MHGLKSQNRGHPIEVQLSLWIEDDKLKTALEGIDNHPVLFSFLRLVGLVFVLWDWKAQIRRRYSISSRYFYDMYVQFVVKVDIIKREGEDISVAVGDATLEDDAAIECAT